MKSLAERFREKWKYAPSSGCWEWTAYKNHKGYGTIMEDGKMHRAHRLSYAWFRGPIPKGMFVCHSCDNPGCVNPYHLFVGSHADNMADMASKGRTGAAKRQGEANVHAKLTEADVLAIRSDARTQREIASDYGVYHSVIGKIKRREAWAHI